MAETVSGKVSWFGGPNDAETGTKLTASGAPTSTPGIAIYNRSTLGGLWRVTDPTTGKSVVLKQTDLGPSPSTGRKIDVTYSALGKFGYSEDNFPTNSTFNATYLGKSPSRATAAVSSFTPIPKAAGLPASSGPNKLAILSRLYAADKEGGASNPLFATGVLNNQAGATSTAKALQLPTATSSSAGVGSGPEIPSASGVTSGPTSPVASGTGATAPSPFDVGKAEAEHQNMLAQLPPHQQMAHLANEIMQWNGERGHMGINKQQVKQILSGAVSITRVKHELTPASPAIP